MIARIYKTKIGYDIVTSNNILYVVSGSVKKIGKVKDNYQSSGVLLKSIPNHLKTIFFQLEREEFEETFNKFKV
jgi:hypothetical protein